MIKNKKSDARPRQALFLLMGGVLAMFFVLGLAQWTSADDKEPVPHMPDSSSIYKDRMPTEAEVARLESPVDRYMALESFSPDQLVGSDLSTSTKDVDRAEVPAGSELQYSIVISNSGDANVPVTMVDALPAGLTYVSRERVGGSGYFPYDPEFSIVGNEVTWKGEISAGGYVEIAIDARIDENVPAGTMLTSVAQISGGGETASPTTKITVLEKVDLTDMNLPMITYTKPDPPDVTNLTATRPNSLNQFTLSWTGGPNASNYEVQQAHDPSFSSPVIYNTGLNTVLALQPAPSWRNNFYYRVRALDRLVPGNWSATINVVGAYYDEFDDSNSGWDIRRTTHIDEVNNWYEDFDGDGWFILEIGDKWDWGISSPLAKAPKPPYVIEYEAMFAQTPNEVSMGIVFGGDRIPGELCPDKSTEEGWYQHTACFNHFYNPHYYWAGEALHLLWYRTDYLVWCPQCDGSPMKRLGYSESVGQLKSVDDDDWNRHRIEVREGSIKYFAGKRDSSLTLQYEYGDTRWINEPYFGVFAYAGEYTSSVARFDYFRITPLDN